MKRNQFFKCMAMLLFCTFLLGCAHGRDAMLRVTDEHVANVKAAKEVADKIRDVVVFEITFIRAALGSNINMLPMESIKAMEYTYLIAKKEGPLTDEELGCLLGWRVNFYSHIVLEVLNAYAPDVLKALKITL